MIRFPDQALTLEDMERLYFPVIQICLTLSSQLRI